jgi:hypothetical protein
LNDKIVDVISFELAIALRQSASSASVGVATFCAAGFGVGALGPAPYGRG